MINQPAKVDVFFPEQPFGGVLIQYPTGLEMISFATGSPVTSVFGRIGNVVAECSDYAACYAPIGAGLPPGGTTGQVLTKESNADQDANWENVPGGGTIHGWTAPTGTAQRSGFDTDAATILDLSQTLKALIDDLTSLGLLAP